MSDRTVVRLVGYPTEDAAFFVDWVQAEWKARFTVPRDHPLSVEFSGKHVGDARFIVASTDEVEWHINTIEWTAYECTFTCVSHARKLNMCTLPDEYLLEMGMVA